MARSSSADPELCPRCDQALTRVGHFWICPEHGEVTPESPIVPLRIFLSYGHDANEELVRQIKRDLEERGHDVWFDQSEIKSGHDWRRSISSESRIHHLLKEGFVEREWIVEAIEAWRAGPDPGSRLFWILCAPGVEKSALAAHLAHFGRDKIIAVQFIGLSPTSSRGSQAGSCVLKSSSSPGSSPPEQGSFELTL